MLVKNFYNIIATIPQSNATNYGYLPVTIYNGETYFVNNSYAQFPYTRTSAVSYATNTTGIAVGTGTDAVKESDYNLGSTITSGINLNIASQTRGLDSDGSPYLRYLVVVTNTSNSNITVTEICYKQTVKVNELPGTYLSAVDATVMLDRTLLDAPITIESGNAGVIEYTIKTVVPAPPVKSGIEIVNFSTGTDEQIAAMIDGAQSGVIDLETDGGWRVKNKRVVRINSFIDGAGVTHAAQDICIAISSFDEYEECGNVLQFDFWNALATGVRMNSSNTTSGGYAGSEMYRTTIPNLVEALPDWLKSRLITFDVQAGTGTVSNNKLALRSEYEIFGTKTHSQVNEGDKQVDYYKSIKTKRRGINGSIDYYWERSVRDSTNFCDVTSYGGASFDNASNTRGVAPFGCL